MSDIGLYGLAIMGQNFALNMASKGFKVSVCNRSEGKVTQTVERAAVEGNLPIFGHHNPAEFVKSLSVPRKIVILVQAGDAVDATIKVLSEHMEAGDVIIDGGNEWFPNSIRRSKELEAKNIMFVGMGISGGEEGARNGPSLMPGGPREAYNLLEPILKKSAAQTPEGPCVAYIGPIGSGNYVKMVHNGIEYGDMQLIAETYDILKQCAGLTNEELSQTFKEWNSSPELDSYLIEITSTIVATKDDLGDGEGYLVDKILDKTGMKGTGRWTIQEGAERSVAIPTIAAALDMRFLSARKDERVTASLVLRGLPEIPNVDRSQVIEDAKHALYAAKVCSYAQGLCLIKAASDTMNWNVDLSECARIWMGGCIIRAAMLNRIRVAMESNPANLIVTPDFAQDLNKRQAAWRRIVSLCVASGIGAPALSASLSYFDTYRRARLPANLVQGQRDFFGGHSFERTDREGVFHAKWTDAHKEIGDVKERNAGNL